MITLIHQGFGRKKIDYFFNVACFLVFMIQLSIKFTYLLKKEIEVDCL